jgi:predicted NACHT family NTPase
MFAATPLRLRVNYPKELHNKVSGPLLIVGAPGYGKTSFCRWHALQDAERFNERSADTLPVYIPLHQLSRKPLNSFEDAFLKTMGKSALISKNRNKSTKKVRVYLDGLDEISSPEWRREIVELLRGGLAERPNLQVIMTSRDYIYGRWLNWLPKVNLSEFDDGEVGEFIEKWLGRGTEISAHFYEQLSSQPVLRTLMRTPLLATLVIMVFRQTRRLPESKTRLYEIFVDLLSGGWDMAKGILRGTNFGQRVKVIVLCSLADKLHTNRRRECSDDLIQEVIKSSIPGLALKDWKILRDEIVNDGLISQSGGVVHFGHLSFQEFLAARNYMGTPHHIRILRVLEDYLYGNDWWRDMLKFYIGLSSGPKQISEWLVRSIGDLKRAHYRKVSVPHAHEVLGGVIEAFPEYPVEMLAGQARDTLDYGQTLAFLQKVKDTIKSR